MDALLERLSTLSRRDEDLYREEDLDDECEGLLDVELSEWLVEWRR